jgi:hypothetical protein
MRRTAMRIRTATEGHSPPRRSAHGSSPEDQHHPLPAQAAKRAGRIVANPRQTSRKAQPGLARRGLSASSRVRLSGSRNCRNRSRPRAAWRMAQRDRRQMTGTQPTDLNLASERPGSSRMKRRTPQIRRSLSRRPCLCRWPGHRNSNGHRSRWSRLRPAGPGAVSWDSMPGERVR